MICLLSAIACGIFCTFSAIRQEHNVIVLKEDCIYVPDDWMPKNEKIQFKTMIKYSEIKSLRIIKSQNNSNNKTITSISLSSHIAKTYFEFTCNDGRTERVFIMYFLNGQRASIINGIKARMLLAKNHAKIDSTEDIVYGKIGSIE